MGVKTAEDCTTHCHRCNKEFDKPDVRMPTPRKHKRTEFWFICLDCFFEEGGVWWAGEPPKVTIEWKKKHTTD